MSEPIKAGDLVQVVRLFKVACACPTPGEALGRVFQVTKVLTVRVRCCYCQAMLGVAACAEDGSDVVNKQPIVYPLERLKRIPPLSELDDVKHDEEITA